MKKVMFDDSYYAAQAHDAAPWLIRNGEHRVVGHYTADGGVSWGDVMKAADKERVAALVKQKLAAESDS